MNAGKLDRVIAIQVNTPSTANEYGETVASWADLYSKVWAAVEDDPRQASVREFFAAAQVQGALPRVFVIRYISGLTEKHRVVYRGEPYNINGIIDVGERNRQLRILATRSITT